MNSRTVLAPDLFELLPPIAHKGARRVMTLPVSMLDNSHKLVLVDAYSLLFRAFFAGRYLSTSDNRPTGALFGFTNMLLSLLNNEKPDAIVVCWDGPERTFRSQEFEAYKAHRPDVDPQLIAQMPVARDVVTAFGIQSAEVPGFEADDLIGTLARQGVEKGYRVTVLTGDSDQLQLVGDGVTVQITQRGVSEVKVYDAEAVRERYGIGPERIADWKALVGDTSDNIPGVPGIGEKTASLLLQKWGTLENLLAHVDEVTPPKAKETLKSHIEQARFSLRLATIVCDVPIEEPIRPYAPTDEDWQRVRDLFAQLEFKTMLARIPRPQNAPIPEVIEREAHVPEEEFAGKAVWIRTPEQLLRALDAVKNSNVVAVHPDTDGAAAMRAELRGVAFAVSAETGYYVPVRVDAPKVESGLGGLFDEEETKAEEEDVYRPALTELRDLFENPTRVKVGHNVKGFEIILERIGLNPTPFGFDTLIAAYLLNSGRSSYPLMDLAETQLGVRLESDDAFAPQETLAREAAVIFALTEPLKQSLESVGMTDVLNRVDMPLIPVLALIEEAGLLIDTDYLGALSSRMAGQMDAAAKSIYQIAGEEFNIGSTKQLQTVLFEKLKLPTGKKTKTGFSTGADLLEQLAVEHEIARKILDYREVAKLKSTYADTLPKLIHPLTGRVHTSLNQTVASTGRLSSSDPNLQNIPIRSEIGREIRRAFVAPKGKVLLSCDYSQIELRLLAHVTKDPALMEAFLGDKDIHVATASTVFGVPLDEVTSDMRRRAKTINFAVIYGQSGFSLAAMLGVDVSTAGQWIKDYFARLPGVKQYVEETTALAHQQKYVQTLMGRRRYLQEIDSGNHAMRQGAERAAVNMPIQGTAADIMKLAMIDVYGYLKKECEGGCTLLLQVHDELLFEVDKAELPVITPHVCRLMESTYPLDVRLKVDAKSGSNWADMSPLHA